MTVLDVTLGLMFGTIGFFLSFFVSRTLNIALLVLMVWVPLLVIERCGKGPDWKYFHNLKDILFNFWKVLMEVVVNMLTIASTMGLVMFALGGLAGFVMHLQLKTKH